MDSPPAKLSALTAANINPAVAEWMGLDNGSSLAPRRDGAADGSEHVPENITPSGVVHVPKQLPSPLSQIAVWSVPTKGPRRE